MASMVFLPQWVGCQRLSPNDADWVLEQALEQNAAGSVCDEEIGTTVMIKLAGRRDDQLLVTCEADDAAGMTSFADRAVTVQLFLNGQKYVFSSFCRTVHHIDAGLQAAMSPPELLYHLQRRRSRRRALARNKEVVLSVAGMQTGISCRLLNASAEGMACRTDACHESQIDIDGLVGVRIELGDSPFDAQARVCACNPAGTAGQILVHLEMCFQSENVADEFRSALGRELANLKPQREADDDEDDAIC